MKLNPESNVANKIPKPIIALSAVSFFLAFNYFILKSLKETLLITAPEAGAEAIPFVKMWFLFPFSLFFLGIFTWMASRISLRFAVSSMILFFLITYAVFGFILYPLRESLHLHEIANNLEAMLPEGWRGFAAVIRYWSYSLFFVTAECWCTMIYSVVFWGYANAAIKLSDAKMYYPYLTLAGTFAALVAGPLTLILTGDGLDRFAFLGFDRWSLSFFGLITSVLICGISALVIFLKSCPNVPIETEAQPNVSFRKALLKLFKSKYLLTLAGVCLTYNLLINLTDVVWKNEVLKLYPNPSEFTSYMSYVTVLTGFISTFFTLCVCRQSLRKYGWTFTALITPILALATGSFFFMLVSGHAFLVIPVSMTMITFFGSLHICLSSGAKYTLFEPTKEMAFIPLSSEDKLHGKAAIDGVGARLGKTTSSLIYQGLLAVLPTISACAPFIGLLMIVVVVACISCIFSLGKQMDGQLAEA